MHEAELVPEVLTIPGLRYILHFILSLTSVTIVTHPESQEMDINFNKISLTPFLQINPDMCVGLNQVD